MHLKYFFLNQFVDQVHHRGSLRQRGRPQIANVAATQLSRYCLTV